MINLQKIESKKSTKRENFNLGCRFRAYREEQKNCAPVSPFGIQVEQFLNERRRQKPRTDVTQGERRNN